MLHNPCRHPPPRASIAASSPSHPPPSSPHPPLRTSTAARSNQDTIHPPRRTSTHCTIRLILVPHPPTLRTSTRRTIRFILHRVHRRAARSDPYSTAYVDALQDPTHTPPLMLTRCTIRDRSLQYGCSAVRYFLGPKLLPPCRHTPFSIGATISIWSCHAGEMIAAASWLAQGQFRRLCLQ